MEDITASLRKVKLEKKRPPPSPAAFSLSQGEVKRIDVRATPARVPTTKTAQTAVVYSSSGLEHDTGPTHQENISRLKLLCDPSVGVLRQVDGVCWVETPPRAELADVLRVHEYSYVDNVRRRCEAASDGTSGHALLDNDTVLSTGSFEAALRAAGAAIHAVDIVVHGTVRNAFVATRPPGHHAGPRGCVASPGFHRRPDMCSSGFCLLNNVAIAAAYARYTYGRKRGASGPADSAPRIAKVAIVDFDIHDGNGTAACVRNLVPHTERLPLPQSWAPVEVQSYAPWLNEEDARNVFFGSVHLFDNDDFYPGSGAASESQRGGTGPTIVNVPLAPVLTPSQKRNAIARSRRGECPTKQEMAAQRLGSAQFRASVEKQLLRTLEEFSPDLVLVSAGFDGHFEDLYHVLSEDDYAWLQTELCAIASRCCEGRLVTILEGGYHIHRTPRRKHQPRLRKATEEAANATVSAMPHSHGTRQSRTQQQQQDAAARNDETAMPPPATVPPPAPAVPLPVGTINSGGTIKETSPSARDDPTIGALGTSCRAVLEVLVEAGGAHVVPAHRAPAINTSHAHEARPFPAKVMSPTQRAGDPGALLRDSINVTPLPRR